MTEHGFRGAVRAAVSKSSTLKAPVGARITASKALKILIYMEMFMFVEV
jgi:hypothetical protein